MKPTICVIPTGGTISNKTKNVGATPIQGSTQNLLRQVEDLEVHIRLEEGVLQKGSAHIVPDDWGKIARAVADVINSGVEGVVILHGTDTMHYTASALSFMLRRLSRPVVITGSMIPGMDTESDSIFNFRNSIVVAACADLAEVCIVFAGDTYLQRGMIIRGVRARKIHSTAVNAFDSINIPPLGYIENGNISYTAVKARRRGKDRVQLCSKLNSDVVLVKQHPGLTPSMLRQFLDGASGAVIEGTGAGHIRDELIEVVAAFNRPVVMSTQTIYGGVTWGLYASDQSYRGIDNFIPAGEMTSETALVKLMWALGQGSDIRKTMLTNIAGELNEAAVI